MVRRSLSPKQRKKRTVRKKSRMVRSTGGGLFGTNKIAPIENNYSLYFTGKQLSRDDKIHVSINMKDGKNVQLYINNEGQTGNDENGKPIILWHGYFVTTSLEVLNIDDGILYKYTYDQDDNAFYYFGYLQNDNGNVNIADGKHNKEVENIYVIKVDFNEMVYFLVRPGNPTNELEKQTFEKNAWSTSPPSLPSLHQQSSQSSHRLSTFRSGHWQ